MDKFTLVTLIVILTAVVPCLVGGYLIAYKQKRSLISGWSDSDYANPKKAAQTIGISLMIMATLLGLLTGLWAAKVVTDTSLASYLLLTSLLPIAALLYVKIKFGAK